MAMGFGAQKHYNRPMGQKTSKHSTKVPTKINRKQNHRTNKRGVHFTDIADQRHKYEFDWEAEGDYWFTPVELKSMNQARQDDAMILRSERHIKVATRDDADALSNTSHDVFIGYKITEALDDADDNHEVSIRGIEHFVHPVLQKEMVRRKKELKKSVLGYSRNPKMRRLDPKGVNLAKESTSHSQWARDVASERGIKYCEMKRGGGRGGGLLQKTKNIRETRRFSLVARMDRELRRDSLMNVLEKDN
eukprot:CAMPEP_0201608846 /NCGR_PEP_ID=MMETSP0492-20130828/9266_1 /ASSEMBLY_ACC=CAM_ASM_000837 /TAXON_ID=420259 /ORGANISM="Thalassiosira gravida, Strain GMp14c1" /LENGTH=247 /DNA_ID=CAMNT_0048073857 /DNA_START=156 /DNA_END=899 /DNA_ORIENTATION=+